jgi:hypothetical protein
MIGQAKVVVAAKRHYSPAVDHHLRLLRTLADASSAVKVLLLPLGE